MVVYGDQKYSAMAKTVGLPAAIATRMLLEGMFLKNRIIFESISVCLDEIHDRGVVVPVKRTIYKPILNELKREGISWTEKTIKNN
jgi:hypothetical protein